MDCGLHEVSFAHVFMITSEAGHIAVGVELSKRMIAEDGRPYYEPYHVLSLYYSEGAPRSLRQTIPVIAADTLRCIDADTKLLVMRSNVPNFRQWRYYEAQISAFSDGVKVKINHNMRTPRERPDVVLLAKDAARRGESLTCEI